MAIYFAWSGGAGGSGAVPGEAGKAAGLPRLERGGGIGGVVGRAIDVVGANGAMGAGRPGVAIFFIPKYFSNHVKMPTIKVKTDTLPQTYLVK